MQGYVDPEIVDGGSKQRVWGTELRSQRPGLELSLSRGFGGQNPQKLKLFSEYVIKLQCQIEQIAHTTQDDYKLIEDGNHKCGNAMGRL